MPSQGFTHICLVLFSIHPSTHSPNLVFLSRGMRAYPSTSNKKYNLNWSDWWTVSEKYILIRTFRKKKNIYEHARKKCLFPASLPQASTHLLSGAPDPMHTLDWIWLWVVGNGSRPVQLLWELDALSSRSLPFPMDYIPDVSHEGQERKRKLGNSVGPLHPEVQKHKHTCTFQQVIVLTWDQL